MLNAEQHNRQFLARVVPLTCLILVFAVFARERLTYSEGDSTQLLAGIDDVRPAGFSKAILVTDVQSSDDRLKPVQPNQPAGMFSTAVTNQFFQQQWKRRKVNDQRAPVPAVKRYLLFSCLRLSEAPLPA